MHRNTSTTSRSLLRPLKNSSRSFIHSRNTSIQKQEQPWRRSFVLETKLLHNFTMNTNISPRNSEIRVTWFTKWSPLPTQKLTVLEQNFRLNFLVVRAYERDLVQSMAKYEEEHVKKKDTLESFYESKLLPEVKHIDILYDVKFPLNNSHHIAHWKRWYPDPQCFWNFGIHQGQNGVRREYNFGL